LISISDQHSKSSLSAARIQAQGTPRSSDGSDPLSSASDFFSLSKIGELKAWVIRRGWISWLLWVAGVTLRWITSGAIVLTWRSYRDKREEFSVLDGTP
jgi:hypothetical protein